MGPFHIFRVVVIKRDSFDPMTEKIYKYTCENELGFIRYYNLDVLSCLATTADS